MANDPVNDHNSYEPYPPVGADGSYGQNQQYRQPDCQYQQPNYQYQQPNYQYQQPNYQYQQPYAPYQQPYYGYPQAAFDPGKSEAENCRLFGILSLFLMPFVFSILGLINYSTYQKIGNGAHQSEAKVGRVCSIISLVLHGLGVLGFILIYVIWGVFLFSEVF